MAGTASSGVKKVFKFLPGDAASRDPYAWDLTDVGKVQTMVGVVYNKKARKKTSKNKKQHTSHQFTIQDYQGVNGF